VNPLRCAACGITDYGVQTRVVEVNPDREIQVYANSPSVPERFKVEARCIDKEACQDRQYAAKESA
jgi:hypothetical protein